MLYFIAISSFVLLFVIEGQLIRDGLLITKQGYSIKGWVVTMNGITFILSIVWFLGILTHGWWGLSLWAYSMPLAVLNVIYLEWVTFSNSSIANAAKFAVITLYFREVTMEKEEA
jgi:hypothetical protein